MLSSKAEVVFEVLPEHYSVDYAPKTASYEKSVYTDCLRLVESVDFDIKIVSIRDRMQKLRPLQDYCYSQERYYRSNKRYYRLSGTTAPTTARTTAYESSSVHVSGPSRP